MIRNLALNPPHFGRETIRETLKKLNGIKLFHYCIETLNFLTYIKSQEEAVNHDRSVGGSGERLTRSNMAYTPQHIANYFLDRAAAENRPLSPLKLLKLVYIAYGWNLATKGEPLFKERIEAWQHGPVVPSVYHEFKHFGSRPISGRSVIVDYSKDAGNLGMAFITPHIPDKDIDTNLILDRVWSSYRDFSGWQLRDMTHEHDTPWSKVYEPNVRGIQIKDEDVRAHYVDRIGRYIAAANSRTA